MDQDIRENFATRHLRVMEDRYRQAVEAGELSPAGALLIGEVARGLAGPLGDHAVAKREIATSSKLSDEGRRGELTDAAWRLGVRVAPVQKQIDDGIQQYVDLVARAPRLFRDGDRWVERRPEALPFEALRQRYGLHWDHLVEERAKNQAAYYAGMRRLIEAGEDEDGLVAAALAAPKFLGLADDSVRQAAADAHIRDQGLEAPLKQAAFLAGALRHLSEGLQHELRSAGAVQADRELIVGSESR